MHKRVRMELAEECVNKNLLPHGTRGVVAVHVHPGLVHERLNEVVDLAEREGRGGRGEHAEVARSVDVERMLGHLPAHQAGQDLLRRPQVELQKKYYD